MKADSPVYVVDQVIQRWARATREVRKLHVLEILKQLKVGVVLGGAVSGLNDQEAAFDRCLCEADLTERLLIIEVYCTGKPMATVAEHLGIDRNRLYERLDNALFYFKGALRSRGFRI